MVSRVSNLKLLVVKQHIEVIFDLPHTELKCDVADGGRAEVTNHGDVRRDWLCLN